MEKSLFAQVGEVKGKKSEDRFTFTFQFTPSDEHLKELRGTIFTLIQVGMKAEEKPFVFARDFFESIKSGYYSASGNNLKALEASLDDAKGVIKQKGINVQITTAVLWGSVLYVGKVGGGGLVLGRGVSAREIDFSKVASGALIDKDTLVLASPDLMGSLELEKLGTLISKADFEEVVADLQKEYQEKEGSALIVRLSVQEPIEKIQPLLIADLDKQVEMEPQASSVHRKPLRLPALNLQPLKERWPAVKAFGEKVTFQLRDLARKASFILLSPWLPRVPGELGDDHDRKRKRTFQIAVLLAAILIISIGLGVFNRSRRAAAEKQERIVSEVESRLNEADNLKSIDSAAAANLLLEAEGRLDELSDKNKKALELREKLENMLAEINHIYKVDLVGFADLTSLKGGINCQVIKSSGDFVYVLDRGTGSIYRIGLADKEPAILVSEESGLENFGLASSYLYLQTGSGIKRVGIQMKTENDVIGSSESWKKLIAADTYKDNFYLLDSGAKQIWKYNSTGGGLAAPQGYFVDEFKDTPVAFSIDGAIWVATENDVFKFFGGKREAFEIKDLPRQIGKIGDIYTNEGAANLYVLDKNEGGLFVIEKTSGSYSSLYLSDQLKEARAISVNETKKIAFVLIENTIYSFNLK